MQDRGRPLSRGMYRNFAKCCVAEVEPAVDELEQKLTDGYCRIQIGSAAGRPPINGVEPDR